MGVILAIIIVFLLVVETPLDKRIQNGLRRIRMEILDMVVMDRSSC